MSVSQTLTLTESSYSASDNTSKVRILWKSTQSGASHNDYTLTAYYWVSKNGGSETKYSVSCTLPANTTKTILDKTITVTHKIDGTGSVKVRTSLDTNISVGVVTKSATKTLTTIDRSSSLSLSPTSVKVGDTIKATLTRKNANFTHTVNFYIGDTYDSATYRQRYTDVSTSQSFTIPSSWASGISGSSVTAKCTVRTKYNGSNVGSLASKTFTITKSSSSSGGSTTSAPTITSFTISPDYIVSGTNSFTLSASVTPASGTTISKYTFESSCLNNPINITSSSKSASTVVSWNNISGSSTATFKVTVTDSNNKTATQSKTLYLSSSSVDTYKDPKFTMFSISRANSDGTTSSNGTYLKFEYTVDYHVDSNNIYVILYYKINGVEKSTAGPSGVSNGTKLVYIGDTESDITGYGYAYDSMGGSCFSYETSSYGSTAIINIKADGTGLAIGKKCESNIFECNWPAKFLGATSFNSIPTVDVDGESIGLSLSNHTHEEFENSIMPSTTNSFSLGSNSNQWDAVYTRTLYINGEEFTGGSGGGSGGVAIFG